MAATPPTACWLALQGEALGWCSLDGEGDGWIEQAAWVGFCADGGPDPSASVDEGRRPARPRELSPCRPGLSVSSMPIAGWVRRAGLPPVGSWGWLRSRSPPWDRRIAPPLDAGRVGAPLFLAGPGRRSTEPLEFSVRSKNKPGAGDRGGMASAPGMFPIPPSAILAVCAWLPLLPKATTAGVPSFPGGRRALDRTLGGAGRGATGRRSGHVKTTSDPRAGGYGHILWPPPGPPPARKKRTRVPRGEMTTVRDTRDPPFSITNPTIRRPEPELADERSASNGEPGIWRPNRAAGALAASVFPARRVNLRLPPTLPGKASARPFCRPQRALFRPVWRGWRYGLHPSLGRHQGKGVVIRKPPSGGGHCSLAPGRGGPFPALGLIGPAHRPPSGEGLGGAERRTVHSPLGKAPAATTTWPEYLPPRRPAPPGRAAPAKSVSPVPS